MGTAMGLARQTQSGFSLKYWYVHTTIHKDTYFQTVYKVACQYSSHYATRLHIHRNKPATELLHHDEDIRRLKRYQPRYLILRFNYIRKI